VGYNFAFWPKVQIGLLLALISLPPRPIHCLPGVRLYVDVVSRMDAARSHLRHVPHSPEVAKKMTFEEQSPA
jgi:hypothetical protein